MTTKLYFVVGYSLFLSFFLFIGSLPNSPVQNIIITAIGFTPEPPVCVLTGTFVDIFGIAFCAVQQLGFFISLMGISVVAGYGWLWSLVFAPLVIGIAWTLAEFLRGTS